MKDIIIVIKQEKTVISLTRGGRKLLTSQA